MAAIIYRKNNKKVFGNIEEYYLFLLNQLKLFEREFGKYIHSLQYNKVSKSTNKPRINTKYSNNFRTTIQKLCNMHNIVSIDTFNYGKVFIKGFDKEINNINGTVNNPIFRVDSNAFMAPNPRYIFTKTNRRMNLDMTEAKSYKQEPFENIIIFGSSLSAADYSYFFSIFDKINICDLTNSSTVVFAFNIYDKDKEESIKKDLTKSVFKLFQEYSKYKGNNTQPNRLLDALTTQGKVMFYEIS